MKKIRKGYKTIREFARGYLLVNEGSWDGNQSTLVQKLIDHGETEEFVTSWTSFVILMTEMEGHGERRTEFTF